MAKPKHGHRWSKQRADGRTYRRATPRRRRSLPPMRRTHSDFANIWRSPLDTCVALPLLALVLLPQFALLGHGARHRGVQS